MNASIARNVYSNENKKRDAPSAQEEGYSHGGRSRVRWGAVPMTMMLYVHYYTYE